MHSQSWVSKKSEIDKTTFSEYITWSSVIIKWTRVIIFKTVIRGL